MKQANIKELAKMWWPCRVSCASSQQASQSVLGLNDFKRLNSEAS